MQHVLMRISLLAWLLGSSTALPGQNRDPGLFVSKRDELPGPAYLTVTMTSYGAWLRFAPVANAVAYNVTRLSYPGSPEVLIASRTPNRYVFEGNRCVADGGSPACVYFDNQFRTAATNLTITYRVYALVRGPNGPVTTSSSPPASVVWKCPDCPSFK